MSEEARALRLEETWERYEAGQPARDEIEAAAYQRWSRLEAEAARVEGHHEAQLEAASFDRDYEAGA
jgi:hypothetical protein